jgi:hypothetical protein
VDVVLTSTIILSGNVVVDSVAFSWWVRDGSRPLLTVSHHEFGTETEPLGDAEPLVQARAIAKKMVASTKAKIAGSVRRHTVPSRPEQ